MNITITTIPHAEQEYDTVGNYQLDDKGDLHITISEMGDWRKEMCVAIHELHEALECKANGVSFKSIDYFDLGWKEHDGIPEPGDDPKAPYATEHAHAMVVERHLANCLGLSWLEYEKALDAL